MKLNELKIGETILASTEFKKINWRQVADVMGGHLIKSSDKDAEIFYKNQHYIISDNGGEVNISKVIPAVKYSVPYTAHSQVIDSQTFGYRIATAIEGKKIDYDFKV